MNNKLISVRIRMKTLFEEVYMKKRITSVMLVLSVLMGIVLSATVLAETKSDKPFVDVDAVIGTDFIDAYGTDFCFNLFVSGEWLIMGCQCMITCR